MDPNATWKLIREALADNLVDTAVSRARNLRDWIHGGGYYPDVDEKELICPPRQHIESVLGFILNLGIEAN